MKIESFTQMGPLIRELVRLTFVGENIYPQLYNDKAKKYRRITIAYYRKRNMMTRRYMDSDKNRIDGLMEEVFDNLFERMITSIAPAPRSWKLRYQIRIPYDICSDIVSDKGIQERLKRNLIVKEIVK